MSAPILDSALDALSAGIAVFPPKEDGSKAPGGAWKTYQRRLPTESEVRRWYANGRQALGAIGGAVSGDLVVLDFDEPWIYAELHERATEAGLAEPLQRIEAGYFEETPGGAHLAFRCPGIGSRKLAQREKRPEERRDEHDRIKTLIETKGEGGFAIIAPSNGSVHPTGKPYVLRRGGVHQIAQLTPDEAEALFQLCRTFDAMPAREERGERRQADAREGRPGDDFTARTTWPEVLEPRGWVQLFTRSGITYWKRPGKEEPGSAPPPTRRGPTASPPSRRTPPSRRGRAPGPRPPTTASAPMRCSSTTATMRPPPGRSPARGTGSGQIGPVGPV